MTDHVLASLKAYVALIGAIVTAVLGTVPPDSTVWTVLTVAAAICTAIATWTVPNVPNLSDTEQELPPAD